MKRHHGRMNDKALPKEHGSCKALTGIYGMKNLKWPRRIELMEGLLGIQGLVSH